MSTKVNFCSWNILADAYAFGQTKSSSTPSEILLWDRRFEEISKFLKVPISRGPGIICLQEVDHFETFSDFFSKLGYQSVYLQRPQRKDGCFIGYSNDYVLEAVEEILFDSLTSKLSSNAIRSYFEKQNVALLAKFACKNRPYQKFIATNAHLYWNPTKPDVKLMQTRHLINRIYQFRGESTIPVVVMGDFNSLPQSEPYTLLIKSTFDSPMPFIPSTYFDSVAGITSSGNYLYGPDTKFMCDQSLSRLCRWMRVLGIDAALETAEMKQARTKPVQALNSVKSRTKQDYSLFFEKARKEKRVILTSSRQMRERATCPQSMLIPSTKLNDLELVLVDICREFGLQLDPDKFLTVCGKCGSDIESCMPDDPRFEGRSMPKDRPVYVCCSCNQPYWWNDRENSSPARAMKMAGKLYSTIKSALNSVEISLPLSENDCLRPEGFHEQIKDEGKLKVAVAEAAFYEAEKEVEIIIDINADSADNGALSAKFAARDEYMASHLRLKDGDESVGQSDTDTNLALQSEALRPVCRPLNLNSVFMQAHGKEPDLTNWSGDFMGTLDYVFVSDNVNVISASVIPKAILGSAEVLVTASPSPSTTTDAAVFASITSNDVTRRVPCDSESDNEQLLHRTISGPQPSEDWPSDHLMLLVELSLPFEDSTNQSTL